MSQIVVISEENLKKLFYEWMESFFKNSPSFNGFVKKDVSDDELITSLVQISKLLRCSLPTAQKIKNSIPKDQYMQVKRKFAIKKSLLLNANKNVNNGS